MNTLNPWWCRQRMDGCVLITTGWWCVEGLVWIIHVRLTSKGVIGFTLYELRGTSYEASEFLVWQMREEYNVFGVLRWVICVQQKSFQDAGRSMLMFVSVPQAWCKLGKVDFGKSTSRSSFQEALALNLRLQKNKNKIKKLKSQIQVEFRTAFTRGCVIHTWLLLPVCSNANGEENKWIIWSPGNASEEWKFVGL